MESTVFFGCKKRLNYTVANTKLCIMLSFIIPFKMGLKALRQYALVLQEMSLVRIKSVYDGALTLMLGVINSFPG